LDEDKPFKQMVKKQNFCVMSMLTPNSFPENKREQYRDQKILGIKVRGVFETYEDARTRADQLQKMDKHHNIFVGEIGKWLPFDVDISTMETEDDPVYREQALNQYMKAYKDCLKEEEVEEKERKEQTLKANNAKVVTGMTDAPDYTGIGCPEITPPGIVPQSYKSGQSVDSVPETDNSTEMVENNEDYSAQVNTKTSEKNVDDEIRTTQSEKSKIVSELEDSKANLKELESKLAAINQIYADLKK
jgi:hypothetical protein